MNEIKYENWIEDKFWTLEEAVGLVAETFSEEVCRKRTYKKAINDIRQGFLEVELEFEEPDFEFHDGGMDQFTRNFLIDEYHEAVKSQDVRKASKVIVESRIFINWCNKNQIHVNPKLNRFFNYDYWLNRKYWNFHEAVTVILSNNIPPFPHEIENVFEKDDEHFYFATELKKIMDDFSNEIECYRWKNDYEDIIEFEFYSSIHNAGEVWFEKNNLLLRLTDEIDYRNECLKNNRFKIISKKISRVGSELLERENRIKKHFNKGQDKSIKQVGQDKSGEAEKKSLESTNGKGNINYKEILELLLKTKKVSELVGGQDISSLEGWQEMGYYRSKLPRGLEGKLSGYSIYNSNKDIKQKIGKTQFVEFLKLLGFHPVKKSH